MSFKTKMLAAAATLTLVGGAAGALAAGPANAATPSCGHRCVNLFSKKFSDVLTTKPGFVLDVLRQGAKVGQPIIMFQSSNADPAEDFTVSLQGTVSDFVHRPARVPRAGPPLRQTTSAVGGRVLAERRGQRPVCRHLGRYARHNTPVSLQPCGVSARTVWVTDVQNIARWPVHVPVCPADQRLGHQLLAPVRADLPEERYPDRHAAAAAFGPEPDRFLARGAARSAPSGQPALGR